MTISSALLIAAMELAAVPPGDALQPQSNHTVRIADTSPVLTVVNKPPASTYPTSDQLLTQSHAGESMAAPRSEAIGVAKVPSVTTSQQLAPNQLLLAGCMVHPLKSKEAKISPNVPGKLIELRARSLGADGKIVAVPIREGMLVKEGQVLGCQDDRISQSALIIAKAKLRVAEREAEKEVEVNFAKRSAEAAQTRITRYRQANAKTPNTIPDLEVMEAELQLLQAVAKLELEQYNLEVGKAAQVDVQKAEVEAAKIDLERQQFTAPFDGMVIAIFRTEGEWIREGDPILHLIQLDTLELEGHVDPRLYTHAMLINRQAVVATTDPAGNRLQFSGKVVFIDPIVGSQGFAVRIEVRNAQIDGHWQLYPGMQLDAIIHLDRMADW